MSVTRAALLLSTIALIAPAALASSLGVDAGNYAGNAPDVNWWGQAWYLNDAGEPGIGVGMSGNLSIHDGYGFTADNVTWSTMGGWWEGNYVSTLAWYTCYNAAINARTFDHFQQKYSSAWTCNPPPPGPGGQPPIVCTAANEGTTNCTPIVIGLMPGPYRLSSADDGVRFDIDADGVRDRVAWTEAGSRTAFLALDGNGNRSIDDGLELFGATHMADNGFESLRRFDSNSDGEIDDRDLVWRSLLLWVDGNHDGRSDRSELMPIGEQASGLSLRYQWSGRTDSHGNQYRFQAVCRLLERSAPCYDVALVKLEE
jgi:hypothetical protein